MNYRFLSPTHAALWTAYHDIRRIELFERRGRFGIYDAHHPDEFKAGHFPKLLLLDETPIGVIRIDIDGDVARFRRVAIKERCQRQGHGRILLAHAEAFAGLYGINRIEASVAADAVPFYRRCAYQAIRMLDEAGSVRMAKMLDQ